MQTCRSQHACISVGISLEVHLRTQFKQIKKNHLAVLFMDITLLKYLCSLTVTSIIKKKFFGIVIDLAFR